MKKFRVKVTFTEEVLGTASNNKELHREFIASKAPDAQSREEEVAAIGADEVFDKGLTVFHRDEDGRPIVFDYQWKGFFKESIGFLKNVSDSACSKLKAHKKKVDGLLFVYPRKIPFEFDGEIGICERPLRAQTAQGERTALASSETISAGATMEFEVKVMVPEMEKPVLEALEYGEDHGFGQWRNSGAGRFKYEILEET